MRNTKKEKNGELKERTGEGEKYIQREKERSDKKIDDWKEREKSRVRE